MNKTLVFYWYSSMKYSNDITYSLHLSCLRKYSSVFNKAVFVIAVDDLNDTKLIKETKKAIVENVNINNISFYVIINDRLCETNAFKKHVLDYNPEYNEVLFFAHTKGLRIINDYPAWTEYYIDWILCLYFYSLNFDFEMETKLFGGLGGNNSAFFGSIMAMDNSNINKGLYYPGTFYWVNINKIKNDEMNGIITIPNFCYRSSVEDFPKIYNKTEIRNTSHDNKFMNEAPYYYDAVDYYNLIGFYGNKEEYYKFKSEIMSEIKNTKCYE